MKIILKRTGQELLVDDADWDWLKQFGWCAANRRGTWYAVARIDGRVRYMHRVIMGNPDCAVDHINGNGLDNQRNNLRLATSIQNSFNSKAKSHGRTSSFKGVHRSSTGKWISQIQAHGKRYSLGSFDTEIEAKAAYIDAAKVLHGDFAYSDPLSLF